MMPQTSINCAMPSTAAISLWYQTVNQTVSDLIHTKEMTLKEK